jgi:hypothetical protein
MGPAPRQWEATRCGARACVPKFSPGISRSAPKPATLILTMSTDKKNDPKQPPAGEELGQPWQPGDPIPAGHAVERNTETTWALFDSLQAEVPPQTKPRVEPPRAPGRPVFAPTQPMTRPLPKPRPPAPAPGGAVTLELAMYEARRNNRVCPLPSHWQALYDMLPDKSRRDPPPPTAAAAWRTTPSLTKRLCLRTHLEWAWEHGVLTQVHALMMALPEDQWHHMGD